MAKTLKMGLIIWAALIGGLLLLAGLAVSAYFLADPNRTFYQKRFYAIVSQPQLPDTGDSIILEGWHETKRDRRNPVYSKGSEAVNGLFFINLNQPQLTHWVESVPSRPFDQNNTSQIIGQGHRPKQMTLLPDGTYTLQSYPDALQQRLNQGDIITIALAADGQALAYTKSDRHAPIVIDPLDGSPGQEILADFPDMIQTLIWSHDGQSLILSSCDVTTHGGQEPGTLASLYRVNADGTGLQQLTLESEPATCHQHSGIVNDLISLPDGNLIYVYGDTGSHHHWQPQAIVLLNPKTGERQQLESIQTGFAHLKLLQDQHTIAYLHQGALYRRPLTDSGTTDSGTAELIFAHPDGRIIDFVESPDAQQFAYKVVFDHESIFVHPSDTWSPGMGGVSFFNAEVWVVNANGTASRPLIDQHINPKLIDWYGGI
ncbi:MAG: hypothetical protein AAGD25_02035 [Cyanobacteria bacterium P01_F01_bin.150]